MAKYVINALNKKSKINKEIYGHFSEHLGRCIYGGLYVGENSKIPNQNGIRRDVVKALKEMKIPVLRWPGGCFADEYHWKDGIGPKDKRKKMINTHWGGVIEDNSFGTHEYMELINSLECEPYICGNVGSGTVREMSEWIEYVNFDGVSPMAQLRKQNGREKPWDLKYFGVGNENWGCGGNMTAEYYSNEYRRYQTYARNYVGRKLFKIACGPNGEDYAWMDTLMKNAVAFMDGISLHYYTVPGEWDKRGSATVFDEAEYYKTLQKTLRMDEIITNHSKVMDRYDKDKRIALVVDEWGTWYDVEPGTNPGFLYQQNTMRDALVAGINLNIFNKHSDRVRMANIAQLINVLQSVILTDGEKMLLTPTYFVFKMYSPHQDAVLLDSFIQKDEIGVGGFVVPNLYESASMDGEGSIFATVCNLDLNNSYKIESTVLGKKVNKITGHILADEFNAYNDFEAPERVKIQDYDDARLTPEGFDAVIPPHSVLSLKII